ncbi:MAG: DUF4276 family protein [Anaerolineales bacterium]
MARLHLFAEGQTEQTFATELLKLHLAKIGEVYLQPPVLTAHAKGKDHRGGVLKYIPLKNDIMCFMKQEKARDVFFTTMIDLYHLPHDFPGWNEAEKLRHSPYKRVEALEQAFANDIGDSRFIPYIQLHEYEAYLFSDLEQFRFFYEQHEQKIAELKEALSKADNLPELVNDGPTTAPSKRIIGAFLDYDKRLVGPIMAELIGLQTIRQKCPHFDMWLSKLEQLGTRRSY